ncbi:MAG: hypothetical protein AB7O59_01390 [Pirellulales bacterium]
MRISRSLVWTWVFCTIGVSSQWLRGDEPQPSPLENGDIYSLCGGDCCPETCCSDECCDCTCDCHRLLGMLPSDHCFDSFVSPLSNPFFFEDPRQLTEVRGIFLDNSLPNSIGGGDVHVWAAQLRGRLTKNFSVIAPRLGYFQVNEPGGAPVGFPSAPVGFKYTFLRDVERQFLVSGGITYFIPENLNNFELPSDGDFHFFLTGGKQIFDRGHWLSATGFRIPLDRNWGTQFWYWSNQWDYEVVDRWYGLLGINWFHWMSSSNNIGADITGLDLLNVPAGGVAGTNVVSALAGVKWKPRPNVEIGTGFEFPLTNREDILRNRLYVDAILRY